MACGAGRVWRGVGAWGRGKAGRDAGCVAGGGAQAASLGASFGRGIGHARSVARPRTALAAGTYGHVHAYHVLARRWRVGGVGDHPGGGEARTCSASVRGERCVSRLPGVALALAGVWAQRETGARGGAPRGPGRSTSSRLWGVDASSLHGEKRRWAARHRADKSSRTGACAMWTVCVLRRARVPGVRASPWASRGWALVGRGVRAGAPRRRYGRRRWGGLGAARGTSNEATATHLRAGLSVAVRSITNEKSTHKAISIMLLSASRNANAQRNRPAR